MQVTDMAKNDNLSDFLLDIANAIRDKKGSSEPINAQDFSSEIASISSGGGGGETSSAPMQIIDNYLTIEALEDGLEVSIPIDNEYCVDASGIWIPISAKTPTPAINIGQTLSFRGNKPEGIVPTNGYGSIVITKKCNVMGNALSIFFYDNIIESLKEHRYIASSLFAGNPIVSAERLLLSPSTLGNSSYSAMFQDCAELIYPPKLPASTLADSCYKHMFRRCKKIEESPALNAMNLAAQCYQGMFEDCISLKKITLPAKNTFMSCYSTMFNRCSSLKRIEAMFIDIQTESIQYWVNGVSSSGVLILNKENTLTLPSGMSGIPNGWEVVYIPAE